MRALGQARALLHLINFDEPFGLSVIEAMACGLVPVIAASELSAASQFALIDESLFPVRDAALLARRIDWWIAHQAERAEWGEKYAEYTKAHYSVEASVHKFVDMERKAIGEWEPSRLRRGLSLSPPAVASSLIRGIYEKTSL